MSTFEMKEGSGVLFKNARKESESHPDYTGSVMIDGVERWLSGWKKTAKNGKQYLSVSVGKPKQPRAEQPTAESRPAPAPEFDDDLPF